MNSFESMNDDERLKFAQELERKASVLVNLLLRKRQLAVDIAWMSSRVSQDDLLTKLRKRIEKQILSAATNAIEQDRILTDA